MHCFLFITNMAFKELYVIMLLIPFNTSPTVTLFTKTYILPSEHLPTLYTCVGHIYLHTCHVTLFGIPDFIMHHAYSHNICDIRANHVYCILLFTRNTRTLLFTCNTRTSHRLPTRVGIASNQQFDIFYHLNNQQLKSS